MKKKKKRRKKRRSIAIEGKYAGLVITSMVLTVPLRGTNSLFFM